MDDIPPSDEVKGQQFADRFGDWLDACFAAGFMEADDDGRLHPNDVGINVAMVILCGLNLRDPERFEQLVAVARCTEEAD